MGPEFKAGISVPDLRLHPYQGPEDDPATSQDGFLAAVALILTPTPPARFLLVQRASHDADPWSGHMALPGGRRDEDDPSLLSTAIRETREEVGIDLEESGQLLGCLSSVTPRSPSLPPLTILPFVFQLRQAVSPRPASREIAQVLWAPIRVLSHPDSQAIHHHPVGGARVAFPAFQVQGRTVWGLTHRILQDFESRLSQNGETRGGQAGNPD